MKVSINNPCHENWEAMTPNEQGAFCLSCQKTVVDFSQKSIREIKDFFSIIPQTEKVCGRFKSEQLTELSFDDFFVKFRNWILPKKLAVVFFFCFGLSLFSCKTVHEPLMGDVAVESNDSIINTPPEGVITGGINHNGDTVAKAIETNTTTEQPDHKMGEVIALPPSNRSTQEIKCVLKDTLKEENYLKGKVKIDR